MSANPMLSVLNSSLSMLMKLPNMHVFFPRPLLANCGPADRVALETGLQALYSTITSQNWQLVKSLGHG
jgi:hypothetical protein